MKAILAPLLMMTMASVSARAEEPMEKESSVNVQGEAEILSRPDQATVTLGVGHAAPTADQAQARVNEKMQAVMQSLRDLGVPEESIQTASISLNPTYAPPNRGDAPLITGYQASNTVYIRLDRLDQVGPVLDAATRMGGNEIQGIQFDLKDDEDLRQAALAQATKKAYAKAQAMAAALGLKLGRVIELNESPTQVRPLYQQARALAVSDAPTPVASGQISVRALVTLRCALEN